MLANRGTEADLDHPGYVAQRKYDGIRVIVIRDGDRVILRGRSWKNDFADRYPDLVEAIRRYPLKRFVADAAFTFTLYLGARAPYMKKLQNELCQILPLKDAPYDQEHAFQNLYTRFLSLT